MKNKRTKICGIVSFVLFNCDNILSLSIGFDFASTGVSSEEKLTVISLKIVLSLSTVDTLSVIGSFSFKVMFAFNNIFLCS